MKKLYVMFAAAICSLAVSAQTLEVVKTIPVELTTAPLVPFNTAVEIPVEEITAAIGVAPGEAQYVAQKSDNTFATEPTTAGTGYWYNAEGQPCKWEDGSVVFAKWENDAFRVGADENPYADGESYAFKYGFAHDGKVALLDVTVKFGTVPAGEIKTVYEGNVSVDMTVDNTYKPFPCAFDLAAVTEALGSAPTTASLQLVTADGYLATHSANAGFWLTADGEDTGWGENARFFVEYVSGSDLNVGQMPNTGAVGNTYKAVVAFVAGDKAAHLTVTANIIEAPAVDYQTVYTQDLALSIPLNTDYSLTTVGFDSDAVAAAIGCAVDDASLVAENPDGTYNNSPNANGIGFWYGTDGTVRSWGVGCGLFIEYHKGEAGQLYVGMFPEGIAKDDVLPAKIGFANGEKLAMLSVKVTVTGNSGVENVAADSQATVNVYSLQGIMIRHNVKAEEATADLPAGIYIVGDQKVILR